MPVHFNKIVCFILLIITVSQINAQQKKQAATLWDGMAVAGYVNNGGFVNFGGPTVKFIKKPWSFGFGILPTMRIKSDKVVKGAMKNSVVTPTAGFGFTVAHKHFITQVPFYYNAKTATANGKWHVGLGIGYKFY